MSHPGMRLGENTGRRILHRRAGCTLHTSRLQRPRQRRRFADLHRTSTHPKINLMQTLLAGAECTERGSISDPDHQDCRLVRAEGFHISRSCSFKSPSASKSVSRHRPKPQFTAIRQDPIPLTASPDLDALQRTAREKKHIDAIRVCSVVPKLHRSHRIRTCVATDYNASPLCRSEGGRKGTGLRCGSGSRRVTQMGNKATTGPFAPLVVVTRNAIGKKPFNQLRGKAIALHSQGIPDS